MTDPIIIIMSSNHKQSGESASVCHESHLTCFTASAVIILSTGSSRSSYGFFCCFFFFRFFFFLFYGKYKWTIFGCFSLRHKLHTSILKTCSFLKAYVCNKNYTRFGVCAVCFTSKHPSNFKLCSPQTLFYS